MFKKEDCSIDVSKGAFEGKILLMNGKFLRCFPIDTPDYVIWSCLDWVNFVYTLGVHDGRHQERMELLEKINN